LHGGERGFDKVLWDASSVERERERGLVLTYTSLDGEEGYPGTVEARVIYLLTDDNELVISYRATTDRPTHINLTQHTYFNLAGIGRRDILEHRIAIDARAFTPIDRTMIPTGEIASVEGTPFDFTELRPIGERIDGDDEQVALAGGYDHNFVLDGASGLLHRAARVVEPESGRTMTVYTTAPGMQFYSGNRLDGSLAGKGMTFERRTGFCLETQHFPDSPNQPSFPSTVLRPGETYESRTIFAFDVVRALLIALLAGSSWAQPAMAQTDGLNERPRILSVQAHHDDEVMYAATLYAISKHLDGEVDVVVITDGSGGYDYAMLAEPIYDRPIAAEPEARTYLPAVRKQEMLRGGKIIGLRNVFFLDEFDHMYLLDADTVLQHVWDSADVTRRLAEILAKGRYDAVFTLLPTEDTHGHHKSASILALRAVEQMEPTDRPAVLGGLAGKANETLTFTGLEAYPLTRTRDAAPQFTFDRRSPLEVDSLLTYQIIVNWLIAEHKSQGTLQLLVNEWDLEHFWLYDLNDSAASHRAEELFRRLAEWRP